jgi:hypothetical protein
MGHRILAGSAAIGTALLGVSHAEQVDSELLLLVDTSIFVSGGNFSDTLESFAQTFESPSMISTLQSGAQGKIAASLAVFSGPGSQAVTVPWMSIADAASAQAFAAAVRASARPFADFTSSFASALGFATPQFGSETGSPGNGFESDTQVINMTSESFLFPADSAADVQAASSEAILDGVDVINAMVVGTFISAAATSYYTNNIVGGSAGGVAGTVSSSPDYGALPAAALLSLSTEMSAAVPEPDTLLFALAGMFLISFRRRS